MGYSVKYFLKIACVYQIIIWAISAYKYILGIFYSILPEKNSISLLSSIVIIGVSIFVILSNIYLIYKPFNRLNLKHLILNKWINFVQVLHISVLGFSFYVVVGVHVLVYYSYDSVQDVSFAFGFFRFIFEVSYYKSNLIFLGVNLIPLILFLIFNKSEDYFKNNLEIEINDSFVK